MGFVFSAIQFISVISNDILVNGDTDDTSVGLDERKGTAVGVEGVELFVDVACGGFFWVGEEAFGGKVCGLEFGPEEEVAVLGGTHDEGSNERRLLEDVALDQLAVAVVAFVLQHQVVEVAG